MSVCMKHFCPCSLKAEKSIYTQYVLLGFLHFGGSPDPRRGGQAQDLRQGLGLLLLLSQPRVLVLLLQVSHHYVVVDFPLLSVVALVYDDQRQICMCRREAST